MSYFTAIDPGEAFEPFLAFDRSFGFVPNLVRAQALLPRVIEVEAAIICAILETEGALSRTRKESLLLVVAAAERNAYCVTAHWEVLRSLGVPGSHVGRLVSDHHLAGLSVAETALLDFALLLAERPTAVGRDDIEHLRRLGFGDEAILEAILVTALSRFLCALSAGLGAEPDFDPKPLPPPGAPRRWGCDFAPAGIVEAGPGYLRRVERTAEDLPPFAFFRDRFGFIPDIFRAQTLRPDVLEAEARAVAAILLSEDVLARRQKEFMLLAISAANLNTYCVAVHCEMLRLLGVSEEDSDRVVVDHHRAGLSAADEALLDFALKLALRPSEMKREDLEALRGRGFSETQVLEAVVMTALTQFLNTLQMGLGTNPDVPPRRVFAPAGAPGAGGGETEESIPGDEAALLARLRAGDPAAYEDVVLEHARHLYRTLVGLTGDAADAEDAMQSAFLKAFEQIGTFRGEARFSTWLTRIAINEGLQRLRARRDHESLDEAGPGDGEEFRPRQIGSWVDDPETLLSRSEIRRLVEAELLKLPARYRIAVVLRDLEGLRNDEAAEALGLTIGNYKMRLMRGRLMLREALAPHFSARDRGAADA